MNEKAPNFLTQNLQLWQFVIALLTLFLALDARMERRFDRQDQKLDNLIAEIHRVDKEQVKLNATCCKPQS